MSRATSRIARAFDAARDYDAHADSQHEVARRLAGRIVTLGVRRESKVLEIGCGTGFLADAVGDRLRHADWLMTDIAPAMVARARARFAGRGGYRFAMLDGEAPETDGRFDLVCSSLAAQWFEDIGQAIRRQRRLLAPGGVLALALLADGTFAEWREAHRLSGHAEGTRDFPPLDLLRSLGALAVDEEVLIARHSDGAAFLRALRTIGAGTPRADHRPLNAAAMRAVLRRFEAGGAIARYHVATCVFGPLP